VLVQCDEKQAKASIHLVRLRQLELFLPKQTKEKKKKKHPTNIPLDIGDGPFFFLSFYLI
jgi:hypothetical protein